MSRLEGNGASRMVQLMRAIGYNEDVKFHVATVKSVAPFAIRLPGDNFDITDDLLTISQSILPHSRTAIINGGESVTVAYQDGYIKVGDEVIAVETNKGQRYLVLEKVGV